MQNCDGAMTTCSSGYLYNSDVSRAIHKFAAAKLQGSFSPDYYPSLMLRRENSGFNPEITSCRCGEREREVGKWTQESATFVEFRISSGSIRPVDDPSLTG